MGTWSPLREHERFSAVNIDRRCPFQMVLEGAAGDAELAGDFSLGEALRLETLYGLQVDFHGVIPVERSPDIRRTCIGSRPPSACADRAAPS
jgi:hypothetical protein